MDMGDMDFKELILNVDHMVVKIVIQIPLKIPQLYLFTEIVILDMEGVQLMVMSIGKQDLDH
jgi:hypothetical protein